jgi:tRNA A-37 threonylcarbamoyl transferase component Bud32
MDEILAGYESVEWKGAKAALKKLAEVRLRGRKREMIG